MASLLFLQAMRDLNPEGDADQSRIDEIKTMVGLREFNGREWYTYAIKFSDKNVNSIVSGTLCGDNMLESFEC